MDNVLLGKALKAMYKQSGKTISRISEETDISIDSINNLFYARVQKPGFCDTDVLTKALGYNISILTNFLEYIKNNKLENADITKEFGKYILSADTTEKSVEKSDDKEQNDYGILVNKISEIEERFGAELKRAEIGANQNLIIKNLMRVNMLLIILLIVETLLFSIIMLLRFGV